MLELLLYAPVSEVDFSEAANVRDFAIAMGKQKAVDALNAFLSARNIFDSKTPTNNALTIACRKGYLHTPPSIEDPLFLAARNAHAHAINAILRFAKEHGMLEKKLRETDRDGLHALFLACRNNKCGSFRLLMFTQCEISSDRQVLEMRTPDGQTLLHIAALHGTSEAIQLIFARAKQNQMFSQVTEAVDPRGWTALHFGSVSPYGRNIKQFFVDGPSPLLLSRTEDGDTPLLLAVKEKNATGVNELISAAKKSGQIDALDLQGALEIAKERDYKEIVLLLSLAPTSSVSFDTFWEGISTPLHFAAGWQEIDLVKSILEEADRKGVLAILLDQPSRLMDHCQTALHCACKKGNGPIVQMLLEAQSSIPGRPPQQSLQICDSEGRNPLQLALLKGQIEAVNAIVQFLFYQQIPIETLGLSEKEIKVALYFYNHQSAHRESESQEIVKRIREGKLSSYSGPQRYYQGLTFLHWALRYQNSEAVGVFLKAMDESDYSPLFARDKSGMTPLAIAILIENAACEKQLLEFCRKHGILKQAIYALSGPIVPHSSLQKNGESPFPVFDHGLSSPLIVAAASQGRIVQTILEQANVDENVAEVLEGNKWTTAVHNAAEYSSSADAIQWILDAHCRILGRPPLEILLTKDYSGHTPIEYAINSLLSGNRSPWDLSISFSFSGLQKLRYIMDILKERDVLEAALDKLVSQKKFPLKLLPAMVAVSRDAVAYVLRRAQEQRVLAAVLDSTELRGATALHYACRYNKPEIADMLLRAQDAIPGRDPRISLLATVGPRNTPLHFCSHSTGNCAPILYKYAEEKCVLDEVLNARDSYGHKPNVFLYRTFTKES